MNTLIIMTAIIVPSATSLFILYYGLRNERLRYLEFVRAIERDRVDVTPLSTRPQSPRGAEENLVPRNEEVENDIVDLDQVREDVLIQKLTEEFERE